MLWKAAVLIIARTGIALERFWDELVGDQISMTLAADLARYAFRTTCWIRAWLQMLVGLVILLWNASKVSSFTTMSVASTYKSVAHYSLSSMHMDVKNDSIELSLEWNGSGWFNVLPASSIKMGNYEVLYSIWIIRISGDPTHMEQTSVIFPPKSSFQNIFLVSCMSKRNFWHVQYFVMVLNW